MTSWLPRFIAVLSILAAATAAHAQYIFADTNRDGVCDSNDFVLFTTDSIDVWLDTSHNADGSPAVCSTGETLTMDGYEVIVRVSAITIVGFANKRPEFAVATPLLVSGNDATVGYVAEFANTNNLSPGRYLLGTFAVHLQNPACPAMYYIASTTLRPAAVTGFRSQCPGNALDQWIKLGDDFFDACGVASLCDDVKSTTWGHIKEFYR